jgi:hypothetical protein
MHYMNDIKIHKQYHAFRLTQHLFIIIFWNTTNFDQTVYHQVFTLHKNIELAVKMKIYVKIFILILKFLYKWTPDDDRLDGNM